MNSSQATERFPNRDRTINRTELHGSLWKRRAGILPAIVLVATGISGIVYAATTGGDEFQRAGAAIDRQSIAWREKRDSTTGQRFTPIAGLNDLIAVGKGSMSAQVNLKLLGGPAQFRITDAGTGAFHPSRVTFDPKQGGEPFSFGFVSRGSREPDCHQITLEWRQPRSATEPAQLVHGNIEVVFNREVTPSAACD